MRRSPARDSLLACFHAAIAAVDARRSVARNLRDQPLGGDWHLIAVGKAAGAMAAGALDVLGSRVIGGLVVLPPGHLPTGCSLEPSPLRVVESAHPVPDSRSLAAGDALIEHVAGLRSDAQVLGLVSGGASSLVEALLPGLQLGDLQRFNQWALGSGLPVGAVNTLRRRLSRLKGGGLARLLGERRAVAMLVSDVPGDDPRTIGSGLLHADPERQIALPGASSMPRDVADIFARAGAQPDVTRTRRVPVRMVATLRQAREAAAAAARSQGFDVKLARNRYAGDADALGARFARSVARGATRTIHVWGGEATVRLPDAPGRGGRNQHLALSAAMALEHAGEAWLLAAGTDGIDGVTADAGAIVDAETCERGRDAGFDPHVSLADADSGSFLEASGDLVHTGPTLTNVGDLVLALRWGGER